MCYSIDLFSTCWYFFLMLKCKIIMVKVFLKTFEIPFKKSTIVFKKFKRAFSLYMLHIYK